MLQADVARPFPYTKRMSHGARILEKVFTIIINYNVGLCGLCAASIPICVVYKTTMVKLPSPDDPGRLRSWDAMQH